MQALVDRDPGKRFLVIAPKSILVVGWGRDLDGFSWLPWVNLSDPPPRQVVNRCPVCGRRFKAHVSWAHVRTHMARYIADKGEAAAQAALYKRHPELLPPGADDKPQRLERVLADAGWRVGLINPESFKRRLPILGKAHWDGIIVDESSILRSPTSKITKETIAFGERLPRRVCMTATPRPNTSLDVWGQSALIDYCLGGDFYRFRECYYFQGFDGYSWLPRTEDTDRRIWSVIEQRSMRVRLEDCVDLPGETLERMSVQLTGQLAAHYGDMLKNMAVDVEGKHIETSWTIVQLNKLAQITSGYIFDADGVAEYLGTSPKTEATIDMARRLIEDEDRFVVIWCRFPHTEGAEIETALEKYGVSTCHGGTRDVNASVAAFMDRKTRVMIAHPGSGKFGHTWVHSNVAIFHSYDYSWENFFQAKRRIYRMGQTRPVTYLVCVAERTIDEIILERVFSKEQASEAVVDAHVFRDLQSRFQR
jgi:hypothetical protein